MSTSGTSVNDLAGARLRKCSQLRTVRAAPYLDPEAGEYRVVLLERERFCDGYVVPAGA